MPSQGQNLALKPRPKYRPQFWPSSIVLVAETKILAGEAKILAFIPEEDKKLASKARPEDEGKA